MIHINDDIAHKAVNNTSYLYEISCSYQELVDTYGKPTNFDNYKTDANWFIYDDETQFVVTIYNYKDGKNYLGDKGLETKDIQDWNIGGFRRDQAKELLTKASNFYKNYLRYTKTEESLKNIENENE